MSAGSGANASLKIRDGTPGDFAGNEALYRAAFPDEDLLPLVRNLLRDTANTFSLVAIIDAGIAGNVIFTRCTTERESAMAALLAPLHR